MHQLVVAVLSPPDRGVELRKSNAGFPGELPSGNMKGQKEAEAHAGVTTMAIIVEASIFWTAATILLTGGQHQAIS